MIPLPGIDNTISVDDNILIKANLNTEQKERLD
jgi:hypothetical protein